MEKRLKILFLTNILSPYMHEFFENLVQYKEIEFKVASCRESEPDRQWSLEYLKEASYDYKIIKDCMLIKIPFQNRFVYFGGLSLIKKLLFGGYNTVVFKGGTRFLGPFYAFLSRMLGKTTILWEEDNLSGTTFLKKIIKPLYINRFFFNEFIAMGKCVREFLETMLPTESDSIYNTYYVVNNDKFRQRYQKIKNKKDLIKKKLNIDKKERIILCIARFINDKNLFVFIDAIEQLKKQGSSFKCLIIGNGVLESKLRKYIQQKQLQNELIIVPFKQFKKLTCFYSIADVFVLPSKVEPWGLVVNEAMLFDLPVIVSDRVGCGRDLVIDGHNGYVCPYNDHKTLAEKIQKVFLSPIKFGSKSYDIIKDKNFDHVSKTIIAACRGIQGSGGVSCERGPLEKILVFK